MAAPLRAPASTQLSFDTPAGPAAVADVGLEVDTTAHSGMFLARTYDNTTGATVATTWQVNEAAGLIEPPKVQGPTPAAMPTTMAEAPSSTTTTEGAPSDATATPQA